MANGDDIIILSSDDENKFQSKNPVIRKRVRPPKKTCQPQKRMKTEKVNGEKCLPKRQVQNISSSKTGLTIETTTTTIPLPIESIENNLSEQIHSDHEFDINNIKSRTLQSFLRKCVSPAVEHSTVEEIRPRIRLMFSNFKQINQYFRRLSDLETKLNDYGAQIEKNPKSVLDYFDMVYELFDGKATQSAEETAIDKLVYILEKISLKIQELEEAEVDFDNEQNSTYLQADFYAKKYCDVYEVWCKKTSEYYYRSRATHKRLDYAESKYAQFNNAVNEMHRKTFQFPSYDLIDEVIRKCVKQHNIIIAPSELDHEILKIFRDVGKECHNRRVHDTVDCLNHFLGSTRDPALDNKELDSKLKYQLKKGNAKMQKLFKFYAKKEMARGKTDCDDNNDEKEQNNCDNDFVDNFVPDNLSIKTDTLADSNMLSDSIKN